MLSEAIQNQAVWPVIFAITGPICARVLNFFISFELCSRGHHDWPVMAIYHSPRFRHTDNLTFQQSQRALLLRLLSAFAMDAKPSATRRGKEICLPIAAPLAGPPLY